MTAFGTNPLSPALSTFRNYNRRKFRRDIVAGLTVSVVELPQAIAYALIAGVPPEYGIYTSVIQGILSALVSSSDDVTSGPTNTQSLMVAATVTRVASGMGEDVGAAVYRSWPSPSSRSRGSSNWRSGPSVPSAGVLGEGDKTQPYRPNTKSRFPK